MRMYQCQMTDDGNLDDSVEKILPFFGLCRILQFGHLSPRETLKPCPTFSIMRLSQDRLRENSLKGFLYHTLSYARTVHLSKTYVAV